MLAACREGRVHPATVAFSVKVYGRAVGLSCSATEQVAVPRLMAALSWQWRLLLLTATSMNTGLTSSGKRHLRH